MRLTILVRSSYLKIDLLQHLFVLLLEFGELLVALFRRLTALSILQ